MPWLEQWARLRCTAWLPLLSPAHLNIFQVVPTRFTDIQSDNPSIQAPSDSKDG